MEKITAQYISLITLYCHLQLSKNCFPLFDINEGCFD